MAVRRAFCAPLFNVIRPHHSLNNSSIGRSYMYNSSMVSYSNTTSTITRVWGGSGATAHGQ